MKRPARIAVICLTVGGTAVTLLLWAKLKLVAGIPRTVYAEPDATGNSDEKPVVERVEEEAASETEPAAASDAAHEPSTPSP